MINKKKKSTEAANFSAYTKLNQFLNSFNSKRTDVRVQCLNCDVLTVPDKTVPTAIHAQSINKIYMFRICLDCRRSFFNVSDDLKKDFCNNLVKKAGRAEAKSGI